LIELVLELDATPRQRSKIEYEYEFEFEDDNKETRDAFLDALACVRRQMS
jgi:hypothetical protein